VPTPDYKRHDPKGWCGDPTRGAAMGRHSYHAEDSESFDGKLSLRRVRLNSGGYDGNGTYFGTGSPLYWAASEDLDVDYMFRAHDREAARATVLEKYPKAKVRR
jgi:hypothetical protein